MKLVSKIKKLVQEDPRRIVHSIKVGLALTLVSLFYYFNPLYYSFGDSAIWAIITVLVLFEFTVGATLNKGLNKLLGTMLGCAMGVGLNCLANVSGYKGQPFVLGVFIFLIVAAATFSRFLPEIKDKYEYGVLVFILTFATVSVSGYRTEKFVELVLHRLLTIVGGGVICVIIAILICPVWAGQTLHTLVASNIEKLADCLQGFVTGFVVEYFNCGKEYAATQLKDQSFLQVVLDSQSMEGSMVNFAKWEPKHGEFSFHHPWATYLRIGSCTRQCAYKIQALNQYLCPELQAPSEFRRVMEVPCKNSSSELGKTMKALANAMKTMTDPSPSSQVHLKAAKSAIEDLKNSLNSAIVQTSSDGASTILDIFPEATVASMLMDLVKSVEDLCESVAELSRKAGFKSVEATERPQHCRKLERSVEAEDREPCVIVIVIQTELEDSVEK